MIPDLHQMVGSFIPGDLWDTRIGSVWMGMGNDGRVMDDTGGGRSG
jgi:hypothetical protein